MLAGFKRKYEETIFLKYWWQIVLIAIALMILSYFFLDVRLAYYFYSMSSCMHTFFQMVTNLCDPSPHVLLWPVAAFFITYILKKTIIGNRTLAIAFAVCVSNTLIFPIKCILDRTRPERLFSHGEFRFDFFGGTSFDPSFPSGHSETIFAIVSTLACFYPRLTWLFFIIGALLAFVRVVVTAHYVSDVIGGALLGMFVGQWVYSAMKQAKASF